MMTNNEEQENAKKAVQSNHPDDFYHQVLGSFKEKEYTEEEVREKQQDWERYEEPEMKKINHNDFPEYFYAGFWIRFWAFCIDLICISAIGSLTITIFFRLFQWPISSASFSIYGLMSLAIYLAYFSVLTKLNRGQTIGKMVFGIRVICFNEEELSWHTVLVREIACRFVFQANPFLYMGYLAAAFTKRKQHAGDYLADTSVVTLNMIKAFNKQAQI
ncbi:RDD family protein [Enterococcus olivae]